MKINLLELEISSKFKFQIMFLACALIHTTFLIVFSLLQIYILMTFNIFSITFYVIAAYKCGSGEFEQRALLWIAMIYSEIVVHAVLCTVHLGYESYFFLYAMAELSISSYMLFFSCNKKIFGKVIVVFLCVTLSGLAGCQIYLSISPPLMYVLSGRTLSDGMVSLMRLMNISFSTAIIFIFSVMFVVEINALIRELNGAYDKLSYTAMHDSLTGLYNRHSLRDFFDSLDESGNEYCVALGDIDNFKRVNDTYGHDCGDDVLVTVSDIIKKSMAENDLACRWGGEEILIIMRGTRSDCLGRMRDIREQINSSVVETGSNSISVTMTFGFADCHEVENSGKNHMDSIVILVDGRLYVGKKSGKNVIIDSSENGGDYSI